MSGRLETLKQQREALEKSLYTGAQSVRHGDKQIMNRSVDEIRRAIHELDGQIAAVEGRKRSRITYFDIKRGY